MSLTYLVEIATNGRQAFGQLVPLGYDIAAFTPAAYQPGRLPGPYMEVSS